jgi:hypothetical protein
MAVMFKKCTVFGALFVFCFSSICFSQDIDDVFDSLAALMIRTDGKRYSIENVQYDIPVDKDKKVTLKWDSKENGVYEETCKMTFLLPEYFSFSIDSKSDYCGVIIKYENIMEGEKGLGEFGFAQMLVCYNKNKSGPTPMKSTELSWYDCETAYKIKQLFKLVISKIEERNNMKNKK